MEKNEGLEIATEHDENKEIEVPKYYEIEQLKLPIQEIILQLRDKIEKGEYGYVVGDDASGRIPTLIFSNFLKSVYREKGFSDPETFFFAGGKSTEKEINKLKRKAMEKAIKNYQESGLKNNVGKRALLLTEYIVTGESLVVICDALENSGISFDIATVSSSAVAPSLSAKFHTDVFEGEMKYAPSIYGKNKISGVTKNFNDKRIYSQPTAMFDKDQIEINSVRKEVNLVASQIFDWYKKGDSVIDE